MKTYSITEDGLALIRQVAIRLLDGTPLTQDDRDALANLLSAVTNEIEHG